MHFWKIRSVWWLLFSVMLLFVATPLLAQDKASLPAPVTDQKEGEVNPRQLQELVKKENAKTRRKIAALQKELNQIKIEMQQPDVTDIIGGIGYIAGIFGLLFYLAARKKTKSQDKQSE